MTDPCRRACAAAIPNPGAKSQGKQPRHPVSPRRTYRGADAPSVFAEAMRFNKIQVAWYGNKSGMEAVDRASGEVFARIVSRDGSVGYYSHIIVHKDSPFAKVEDILKCDKSLDFGIGDPNSTSGFLVPTAYIFAARNVDPKTCFKTVRNANRS